MTNPKHKGQGRPAKGLPKRFNAPAETVARAMFNLPQTPKAPAKK